MGGARVCLLAALLVLVGAPAQANKHRLSYVGYDHLLDYNPETKKVAAFDIRRSLPRNDTCDIFVYPPLIQGSNLTDSMTEVMDPNNIHFTFLGGEMFMVQNGESGQYVTRRCSGFMPQQSVIPCEVYAIGEGTEFLSQFRYFHAGPNRVFRFNRSSGQLAVLGFDADVHGGGSPFIDTPLVGYLGKYGTEVHLVYSKVSNVELVTVVNDKTGVFKTLEFKPVSAEAFDDLFGEVLLEGTIQAGFQMKTLLENMVVIYDPNNGDFSTAKLKLEDNKIELVIQKTDNIEQGQGCIHHNRQDCVKESGCGWCAESISCHQLDSNRQVCDKNLQCMTIIDEFSPERKKYALEEDPLPHLVRDYGEMPPPFEPVFPLREEHSMKAAVPLLRNNDAMEEPLLYNMSANPAEGLVFLPPPPPGEVPCMDDKYVDPKRLGKANVEGGTHKMNEADGTKAPVLPAKYKSSAESQRQEVVDCEDVVAEKKNVTVKRKGVAGGDYVVVEEQGEQPYAEEKDREEQLQEDGLLFTPGEPKRQPGEALYYSPLPEGTAREEDLMNGVKSHFSSLMPKEGNVVAMRKDVVDPPVPNFPIPAFKPKEGAPFTFNPTPAPFALIPEPSLLQPAQMETHDEQQGCAEGTQPSGPAHFVQKEAMGNAQFQSASIHAPWVQSPVEVTLSNLHDTTGNSVVHEPSLPLRGDSQIVEGWDLRDIPLNKAQETVEKGDGVPAPEPPMDTRVLGAVVDRLEDRVAEDTFTKEKEIVKRIMEKEDVYKQDPTIQQEHVLAEAPVSSVPLSEAEAPPAVSVPTSPVVS